MIGCGVHLVLTSRKPHVPAIWAEASTAVALVASAGGTHAGSIDLAWASTTDGADTAVAVADNKIADENGFRRW